MPTIFIFLAVGILVFIYILLPLMKPVQVWVETSESRAALKEKKESYLRAIKDINFEYASAKINEEDYKELKHYYSLKAAETIKEIEEREVNEGQRKTG